MPESGPVGCSAVASPRGDRPSASGSAGAVEVPSMTRRRKWTVPEVPELLAQKMTPKSPPSRAGEKVMVLV